MQPTFGIAWQGRISRTGYMADCFLFVILPESETLRVPSAIDPYLSGAVQY